MSNRLDSATVARLVKRLCTAQGRPFGVKAGELIELWYEKLSWCPASVVEQAVEAWIDEESKFPTPDRILYRVRKILAEQKHTTRQETPSGFCPWCHTEFKPVGYQTGLAKREDGAIVSRLRCRCPQAGMGWDTERALAYQDPATRNWRGDLRLVKPLGTGPGTGGDPVPVAEMVDGDAYEPPEAA
jgi:hypothetical protein